MKVFVGGVGADGMNLVVTRRGRSVAHPPGRSAGPKGWHPFRGARGGDDDCIELHLVERITILLSAGIGPLCGGAGNRRSFLPEVRTWSTAVMAAALQKDRLEIPFRTVFLPGARK